MIAIPLAFEYRVETAAEGYELVLRLCPASDPFTVRDSDGLYWDFWHETVKVFFYVRYLSSLLRI